MIAGRGREECQNTALESHFAAVAQDWVDRYRTRTSFMARLHYVGRAITEHLPDGGKVLDFGAGAGVFSLVATVKAKNVVALDGSVAMVRSALGRQGEAVSIVQDAGWLTSPESISYVAGSLDCLYVQDEEQAFAGVLAIAVLEYLPDPGGALARLSGLLSGEGTAIVTVPHEGSILRQAERPLDAIAVAIGRVTGWRRLLEREYDKLRGGSPSLLRAAIADSDLRVIKREHIPLGMKGWRRFMKPTTMYVLRKEAEPYLAERVSNRRRGA